MPRNIEPIHTRRAAQLKALAQVRNTLLTADLCGNVRRVHERRRHAHRSAERQAARNDRRSGVHLPERGGVMAATIADLQLKISEAHKALAAKKAADARAKLRDEFALAALPHMLALAVSNQQAAAASYSIADAMLEARNANR